MKSVHRWASAGGPFRLLPVPVDDGSVVTALEKRVTRLEELPARIEDLTSQVSQLRTEMRAEFSAVRNEMRTEFASVRGQMAEQVGGLATQMRVLHEDVIGRIALLQEGRSAPKRRAKKK